MQVFQAVKDQIGDADKPQHFSIEQAPEDEGNLADRNAQLASFDITAIWFEKGCYDYVENILRHAKNELRYRGVIPITSEMPELNGPIIESNGAGFIMKVKRLISRQI